MRSRSHFLLVLMGVLWWATQPAGAADLTKIDRTLRKEPAYQSKPKYCLLVFGPEAKTRVWIVQDGDVLYVDRNGNGDLTEKDKRVEKKSGNGDSRRFEVGDVKDGPLTHTGISVTQMLANEQMVGNAKEFERIRMANDKPWIWWVYVTAERPADDDRPLPRQIKYVINGDGQGDLVFGNRPPDAPVVHLNGPWTLGLQDMKQRLTAGYKENLQIGVGTQGVGPGTFAFVLYPNTIPEKAYPVAEITFPAAPGQKALTEKYTLTQRC